MFLACFAFFVFCVFPVHAAPRDSTASLRNSWDRAFWDSEAQQQETGQSEENPLVLRFDDVNWDMSEDHALQHFLNQHNLNVDRVTYLRLVGFDDMVPSFIFRLTFLEYLNLSENKLVQLPSRIADLNNLQELNLSSNKLESLPESLFDLIGIRSLHLFNNKLCELSERIANLKDLHFLSLSSNAWKKLPEAIKTLPIKELKLVSLPEEQHFCVEMVPFLSQLVELTLWDSNLEALPREMKELSNLKRLDISYNDIDPEKLFLPPNLERLILGSGLKEYDNCIIFPEVILSLKFLEYLDMSTCGLENVPDGIGDLKRLKAISFLNNQIDELPPTLGQLKQLKALILSHNDLRVLPREILSLYLDLLDVSGNTSFLAKGGGLGLGLLELRQRFVLTWDVLWKTFYVSDLFDAVEQGDNLLELEVLREAGKSPEKIAWPNAGESDADFISGLDEEQAVLQIGFAMAREGESFLPESERLSDAALLDYYAQLSGQDKLRSVGDEALIRGLHAALWHDACYVLNGLKSQFQEEAFRHGWTKEAVEGFQNFQQVRNMNPHDLMYAFVRTGKRSADDLSMPGPSKVAKLG